MGSHFFDIDFAQADYLTGIGKKAFIAELMPRFPIYVDLLTAEAKAVIGKTHPKTLPASKVLESEGLKYQNYVDIFDAGPTLEAEICNLRAVHDSQLVTVTISDSIANNMSDTQPYLCGNDNYLDYRACLLELPSELNGALSLTTQQAKQLHLTDGQSVRVLPLNPTH